MAMTWEQIERAIGFLTEQSVDQSVRIQELIKVTNQDAENIRTLARIADIHERRLTRIEGTEDGR